MGIRYHIAGGILLISIRSTDYRIRCCQSQNLSVTRASSIMNQGTYLNLNILRAGDRYLSSCFRSPGIRRTL